MKTVAYFLVKLNPPRPTFALDMSTEERDVMMQHVAYWSKLTEEGTALIFGPVIDPKGVWGLGIIEAADEPAVQVLIAQDPADAAEIGMEYDVFAMPQAVARK